MIRLIDRATGEILGEAAGEDFRVLRRVLQDEDLLDADYYLNPPTLDLLAENGLGPAALDLLRRTLGDRDGMDLGWERVGVSDPRSVSGRIVSEADGRPLPGLKVEAYDGDLTPSDFLGWSFTRPDGRFEVTWGGPHPEDLEVGGRGSEDPELRLQVLAVDGTVLLATRGERMGADSRMYGDLPVPEPPPPAEEEVPELSEEDLEEDPALLAELPALDRPLEHPLGETGGVEPHVHHEER